MGGDAQQGPAFRANAAEEVVADAVEGAGLAHGGGHDKQCPDGQHAFVRESADDVFDGDDAGEPDEDCSAEQEDVGGADAAHHQHEHQPDDAQRIPTLPFHVNGLPWLAEGRGRQSPPGGLGYSNTSGRVDPHLRASAVAMDANQRESSASRAHHERVRRSARQHFDQWALSYDRSRLNELVFFPTIRVCLEELVRWQKLRGGGEFSMLDVGCGTGRLLAEVARWPAARELVGLDYSPVMVQNLRQRIADSPHADKLRALEGDAEHLPFERESFDVVTCCNSFHHYPHQAAVVQGFYRVLRPGGLMILVDGFRDNVIGWLVFDVGVTWVEKDVHHAPWSAFRDLIRGAGFSTLRQRKINVFAPLLVNVARR